LLETPKDLMTNKNYNVFNIISNTIKYITMDNQQLRPTYLLPRYLVDNTGLVYSSKTRKSKTTHITGSGYKSVNLYLPELRGNKNPWCRQLVHRVVAGTFIGIIEYWVGKVQRLANRNRDKRRT
jgi:hypothetical protein